MKRLYRRSRKSSNGRRRFARKASRRPRSRKGRRTVPRPLRNLVETKKVIYMRSTTLAQEDGSEDSAWMNSNTLALLPSPSGVTIVQGTNSGQRIGNKVTIRKCKLSICFSPAAYDALTNFAPTPQLLRVMICQIKPGFDNDSSGLQTVLDNYQFETGTNSSQGFTGTMSDIVYKYNPEAIRVVKQKTFKVGLQTTYGQSGSSSGQEGYFANNDFKLMNRLEWDITKLLPKQVQWEDNSGSTACINRQYWLVMAPVDADGRTGTNLVRPVRFWLRYSFQYSDL